MKNKKIKGITIALALSIFTFQSCKEESDCTVTNISSFASNESHNNGMNCMSCHTSGGSGKGCFSVAGSVYASDLSTTQADVKIQLYTGVNGTGDLKYTIEGDAKGNFHSTDDILYDGLFPTITHTNGNMKHMPSALTSGKCNSCHGVTTDKIWID